MAEPSDKKDKIDEQEKLDDDDVCRDAMMFANAKETSVDNMDTNQNEDQMEKIKTTDNGTAEESTSTNTKRSNDQVENEKRSGSDSDVDSSKKQKLNEFLPSTSTSDNIQDSSPESSSNFRKLESKVRKRNYRSQSDSSDVLEESSVLAVGTPVVRPQEENADSNSSKSVDYQPEDREALSDSSEQRSDEYLDNPDSDDWSSGSNDDIDEMPAVLEKEPSKSNWSIIKDVTNRQIGFNNSVPSRFYSSLHAVQHLELMYKLEEHQGCVNALGFNQKGNLLASASDDLKVTIWDWAIGKKRLALKTGHRSNVFQSKWLPLDLECFVVTCARDGQVRMLDIRSGVHYKVAQHRAACHKVSTHINLPHIVLSAGEDSKVFSIDVRQNKPTKLLSVKENDHEVELYSIHSHPLNDLEFCVAGRPRYVKIYDRRKTAAPVQQLCPKHLLTDKLAHITCAVYNHNGTEIVASYNNDDIYLFDTSSSYKLGDFAHRYQGHRNTATVKGVNFFGPNSEFVLSGSDCGNIFIWDKKTEAIVQWMAGDEQGIVNALEPHPHIPILATSGLDYDVKIWIPSREKIPNIKEELRYCIKRNSMLLGHIRQRQTRNLLERLGRNLVRDMRNAAADIDDDDDEDDEDNEQNNDDSEDSDLDYIANNSSASSSTSHDILSDSDNRSES
ncbi:DDB1- and CUL4-associated factor 8 isoform X1 [Nasonia vitripennis]|uniref:DDB1- and CUL4-associated factor 8 n=1 Tax=Nasonia vitripennis TaxID=7425 RepID=A0A7M7G749_NASVI|nr:DDB1- and CUL4-associated factor 8 isoform X1 [Nasonia vitripennis]